jgi:hypothetical protein
VFSRVIDNLIICQSIKINTWHLTLVPWYSDGLIEQFDSSNLQNKLKMIIENDGHLY